MRFDYRCPVCLGEFEREVPSDQRDGVVCICGSYARRLFDPTKVHLQLPELFTRHSLTDLTPTYQEQRHLDEENIAWVNRKKDPPRPDFDQILNQECEQRRVNPQDVRAYKGQEILKTL